MGASHGSGDRGESLPPPGGFLRDPSRRSPVGGRGGRGLRLAAAAGRWASRCADAVPLRAGLGDAGRRRRWGRGGAGGVYAGAARA